MKLNLSLFLLTATCSNAFVTKPQSTAFGALQSTASPERVAPDAGYVPEWEDRPGLSPEEFMKSDESKPDLSGMWECPLTKWDFEKYVFFFKYLCE